MKQSIRIGNGCGFWGDNVDAPILLAEQGRLDYLTLEYLAELTMSILALLKQRDPQAGYATDFIDVLGRLVPTLKKQPELKIITNAGGMNPLACGAKAKDVLQKAEIEKKIAIVSGDDLMPRLDELLASGHSLKHLDNGESLSTIRSKVVSANAYLGAKPIADALTAGAEIVITGRVADASLTVGPVVSEFGWSWTDWDRLSSATVAGHLIECGAQATGGLWEQWQKVPDFANIGYPIAEMFHDGAQIITKPEGSGGVVNQQTISGQLLYEVIDPARYYTPDVIADFTSFKLTENNKSPQNIQSDSVHLSPAKGLPAPTSYKVSLAYRDGYMCSGMLALYGGDVIGKAKLAGQMILDRLARAGHKFARSNIELIGAGAVVPGHGPKTPPNEVMLRVSVADPDKKACERFSKEFAPLVTAGPPGTTGYTTGRPQVREVFAYWPSLIDRNAVQAKVDWV